MISIHAPRAGGDFSATAVLLLHSFQSTPPVRGAILPEVYRETMYCLISIHAPRAGGDDLLPDVYDLLLISIHAPRAGGDRALFALGDAELKGISIHAPRAGGDC